MGRKVFVVGVGMTKFEKPGSREGWDYPDMAKEAGTRALEDAGIAYELIEQACVGYCYGDSTCGERAVYTLGLTGIPIYNVNNNCSTGSTALFMAKQFIEGGLADCALALGFEKMEKGSLGIKYTDRTNPMDKHAQAMIEKRGFAKAPAAAQFFGNAGREHMEKYGTTPEHFAKIGWKNHKHSVNNPYSQFQDEYSLDDIKNAPMVYEPLTKLQCCPTSDGSGAAILASEDFVRKHGLEAQAVEILMTNLSRASALVQSFKRVAVDQSSSERRRFHLRSYIQEILLSLRPKLKVTPHEVTLDCPQDLLLDSFPGAISQILTNLIVNALVHAYDPGQAGRILIGVRTHGDLVELCFEDNGKGIPAADMKHIFDPFFTTRRGEGGSGLGLHIVHNLVANTLGGTIHCESAERGTRFVIRFPRQPKEGP